MNLQQRIENSKKLQRDYNCRIQINNLTDTPNNLTNYEKIKLAQLQERPICYQQLYFNQALHDVPLRFKNKTFDDFKLDYPGQKEIKELVGGYDRNFSTCAKAGLNCLFYGMPGTGKTFLSLILYQALIKKRILVKYHESNLFLRLLRDKSYQSFNDAMNIIIDYRRFPLLILDEVTETKVGGQELCSWEKDWLFTIINDRYEKRLCTLVITNQSLEVMKKKLGEPIFGRLTENILRCGFNWPSYRENP